MQPISRTRIFIVIFVTLFSVAFTIPTARYYMFLRQPEPKLTAAKPETKTPPPLATEKVAYQAWAKENPEYAKWAEKNQAYLAWEAKEQSLRQGRYLIPLGLDLIGGVDVTLVLDRDKAIATEVDNLANSLNSRFESDKLGAKAEGKSGVLTVTLNKANAADAQRVSKAIEQQLGNRITGTPGADDLAKGTPVTIALNNLELDRAIKTDVEGARRGISERVDALGVTQPRISIQGEDRIRVQVPGEKDPVKLVNTVIQPAALEFRLVDPRYTELIDPQTGKLKPGATAPAGTEIMPTKSGRVDQATQKMVYSEGQILLSKKVDLTGKDLRSAQVSITDDLENPIQVSLNFKDEGARKFADLTTANVGKNLAIVLDGTVRSWPRLNEPIREGRATISGGFTQEEASDLSQILKAGALPAPLKIESQRTVGASMGTDSIKSGVNSLFIGSLFIIVLMIVYYGTAGVISVLALILNILIILALMALSRATLTLSGIGGVLLTVGMAVDANILIYERMREELRSGKPLKQAIGLGFHRAFNVILDSNVTTLLSALVLLQFTEGSVFGFALTMTYGLLANLFTGLTVTYTLCGLWFSWKGSLSLGKFTIFQNANFDFIKMRWFSWISSSSLLVAVMILGIAMMNFGVDFAGGYRAEVEFTQKVDVAKLRDALKNAGLKDANLQKAALTEKQINDKVQDFYIIDMKSVVADTKTGKSASESGGEVQGTQNVFETALSKTYPGAHKIVGSSGFGAQTSQEFKSLAFWVTVLSSGAILLYLWFRFELVFGVAAVASLLHDLLLVFFIACIWGVQVNLEVVAAMMVLMGFSVNDTIVIFDRIRENARIMPNKSFGEICNLAMNQSLSRTILTSGTVLVAALCLFFIGGEGLRSFAKIYVIGTIFGTYSSDFIAAPILYQWNKHKGDRVRQMLTVQKKKKEAAKPIRSGV